MTHVNNLGIIKTVSAATSEIIHISPESVIHIAGMRSKSEMVWGAAVAEQPHENNIDVYEVRSNAALNDT